MCINVCLRFLGFDRDRGVIVAASVVWLAQMALVLATPSVSTVIPPTAPECSLLKYHSLAYKHCTITPGTLVLSSILRKGNSPIFSFCHSSHAMSRLEMFCAFDEYLCAPYCFLVRADYGLDTVPCSTTTNNVTTYNF